MVSELSTTIFYEMLDVAIPGLQGREIIIVAVCEKVSL